MRKNSLLTFVLVTLLGLATCESSTTPEMGFETIAFINGLLIDGTGSMPVFNVTVNIQNGIIQDVGKSSDVIIPENARIIDLKGKPSCQAFSIPMFTADTTV